VTEQDQHDAADATDAVPAPRGPVPDLGFFAGTPQPHGTGGFGGPAPASTGPFGGPAPSQFGGPATSQFGGPATSQFGGPVPAFPGPLGPPPGSMAAAPRGPIATLRSTAAGRVAFRIGVGVAVSVVLGVLGIGRFAGLGLFGGPGITTPATLGGAAPSTGTGARSVVEAKTAAAAAYDGEMVVEVYGDDTSPIVFIGAEGDGAPADAEIASVINAAGGSGARTVDESVCAAYGGGVGQLCARIGDGRVIIVATVARSAEETAAMTDEAWDAQ